VSVISEIDLLRRYDDTRCGGCGQTEQESKIPVTTVVIDWRTELLCDTCIANHDWRDWIFDPVLNLYSRRGA
jgi:alpha-glucosidase (family GH31 glycosyl hydrolase)